MERRPRYNRHHELFYASIWESMRPLKALRTNERLIVPLDIKVHEELHRNISMVPPLPAEMAMRALALFGRERDAHEPIENLENFMSCVEQAMKSPRERELNRSIGESTIWACELQIPFIQEGYIDLNKYK